MLDPAVWSCRADGSDVRTWRLAEEVGVVALRAAGGAVIAGRSGFAFLDLATGRTRAVTDPEGRSADDTDQRRQGRPRRPARRRLHGRGRLAPDRRAVRSRPRPRLSAARRRLHRGERPVLEPRWPDPLLCGQLDQCDLCLRLRAGDGGGQQQAPVRFDRGRSGRPGRGDGRCGGVLVECPGLRRCPRPLRPGRRGSSGGSSSR